MAGGEGDSADQRGAQGSGVLFEVTLQEPAKQHLLQRVAAAQRSSPRSVNEGCSVATISQRKARRTFSVEAHAPIAGLRPLQWLALPKASF